MSDHCLGDGLGAAGVLSGDEAAVLDEVDVEGLVRGAVGGSEFLEPVLQAVGDGVRPLGEFLLGISWM